MNPEPGWYYADGDPEGTVRLWNGDGWIGFPQRVPGDEADALAGVKAFEPVLGQSRVGPLGVLVQIVLGLFALAQLMTIVVYVQLAGVLELDLVAQDAALEEDVGSLWSLSLIALPLLQLVALFTFLPWMAMAYGNVGRWHKTAHSSGWAVLAWFVPIMNFVRPARILMEMLEHSPPKGKESETNPVLGVIWWAFWITPTAIYILLFAQVGQKITSLLADPLDIAKSWLFSLGAIAALNAGALITAVLIVRSVSRSQDARLYPSKEQQALADRERAHAIALAATNTGLDV